MPFLNNPVALVAKPRLPPGRDRRLRPGEEARLLMAIDEGTHTPWLEPAVVLAIETGMRKGELLALCWKTVDLERRIAHLSMTKNGTSRNVPLSPRALETLRALPQDTERVLPTTHNALKLAWNRARTRAGMRDLRFHDLRHEATSRLFEKRLNPMEVASITGHRTLQMLSRYTHLQAEDLATKLAKHQSQ
jgi:integrase